MNPKLAALAYLSSVYATQGPSLYADLDICKHTVTPDAPSKQAQEAAEAKRARKADKLIKQFNMKSK